MPCVSTEMLGVKDLDLIGLNQIRVDKMQRENDRTFLL